MGNRGSIVKKLTKITLVNDLGEEVYTDTFCNNILDDDSWHYKKNHSFSKVYRKAPNPFDKYSHNGYFSHLLKHLEANTNIILVLKNKRYELASSSDLMEMLGVSEKTMSRFIGHALRNKVFATIRIGKKYGYIVNPIYCFNGNNSSPTLYMLFREDYNFMANLSKFDIAYLDGLFKDINVKQEVFDMLNSKKLKAKD